MLRIVVLSVLFSLLTACGGGGGGGGGSTPSNGGPSNKSAAGVWDNSEQGANFQLITLIDERSHALLYIPDAPLMLQCPLKIDGSRFTCTPTSKYSVAGTISEKRSLKGTISEEGTVIYNFELTYHEFSDTEVSIDELEGFWEQSVSVTETIQIKTDGEISGSDNTGCIVNGEIEYISPNVNVQSIRLRYSNCDREGQYYGKSIYLVNPNSVNDPSGWLVFTSSNELIYEAFYLEQ
ncbi:hypothetical protein [Litoribrevibacter albus]|uniref:Lipoprotein n=1 Tax=Litoribrevibacter albus TaxID=1473156 RepID=A0AA37SB12_9GAMM|nr:hypothetical protein [Litoribrevibacter albus]GLQ31760.1 hypothetical protein GCM10007876_22390 [Litoribrevibacter albus]